MDVPARQYRFEVKLQFGELKELKAIN
jgi:hypothetical protein